MIIAKTPWLKNDKDDCIATYNYGYILFACVYIVEEYFEIPEDATIRFVVYNRPSKDRYSAFTFQGIHGLYLCLDGDQHGGVFNALAVFLKKFELGKIYYVECEIK